MLVVVFQQSSYECLRKPSTINEWLLNLGLPQYITVFFEHGWDQVDFIYNITFEDLKTMKIQEPEHQQRLLKSIKEMMQ